MREYNFEQDLKCDRFEQVFAQWLIDEVKCDKSEITISKGYFPEWDVKCGEVKYEVKRDYWYHKTKNCLVELWYNLDENKWGWIYHTKADYLVVFISDTEFYIMNMVGLKRHLYDPYTSTLWHRSFITQKDGSNTVNYIIKLDRLRGLYEWHKINTELNTNTQNGKSKNSLHT